ncbi:MAG: hypothetical protein RIR34_1281 [Actinomycetota bacterium]|jgi:hypothetical protein
MNKRLLIALAAIVSVFVIGIVGASVLNLSGSDSAPGEAKTDAACATNMVVKTPVETEGHDQNSIVHMVITGNLTACVGQTLRAEIDMPNNTHVWAVRKITTETSGLTLNFNATNGDFYDGKPVASNGDLTVAGNRVGPIMAKDFGLATITIAKTWE